MAILKVISYLAGGVEGSFGGKILLAGWVSSDPEQWRQAGDVRSREPEAEVASVQLEIKLLVVGMMESRNYWGHKEEEVSNCRDEK